MKKRLAKLTMILGLSAVLAVTPVLAQSTHVRENGATYDQHGHRLDDKGNWVNASGHVILTAEELLAAENAGEMAVAPAGADLTGAWESDIVTTNPGAGQEIGQVTPGTEGTQTGTEGTQTGTEGTQTGTEGSQTGTGTETGENQNPSGDNTGSGTEGTQTGEGTGSETGENPGGNQTGTEEGTGEGSGTGEGTGKQGEEYVEKTVSETGDVTETVAVNTLLSSADAIQTVNASNSLASTLQNLSLISKQTIVKAPEVENSYRFVKIDAEEAIFACDANIYESEDVNSKVVGTAVATNICYILQDRTNGWFFVESGIVRGYVQKEMLLVGDNAKALISYYTDLEKKRTAAKEERLKAEQREAAEKEKLEKREKTQENSKKVKEKLTNLLSLEEGALKDDSDLVLSQNLLTLQNLTLRNTWQQNQYTEALNLAQGNVIKNQVEEVKEFFANEESSVSKVYSLDDEKNEFVLTSEVREDATAETIPLSYASATVLPSENAALSVTRTTARNVLVKKTYLVANKNTSILESPILDNTPELTEGQQAEVDRQKELEERIKEQIKQQKRAAGITTEEEEEEEAAKILGTLPQDGLVYLLSDEQNGWLYVESGDVRGFVKSEDFLSSEDSAKIVQAAGEENLALAQEITKYQDNSNIYYTLTSTKEGKISSALRSAIVSYAMQFQGNPYVWGGTDPVYGADCSGFVQTIYKIFGYDLPRTSREQAKAGLQITLDSIEPGDLIFYASGGRVYHVAMYAGNGKTIEAYNSSVGIVYKDMDTANAVWACRYITDDDEEYQERLAKAEKQTVTINTLTAPTIGPTADTGQYGEYLGCFMLTAYCPCSECCGKWANGITASGNTAVEGRTVAMFGVPMGTKVIIGGQIYTVEDTGTPYGHLDIYMDDHDRCNEFGVKYADVYLLNE